MTDSVKIEGANWVITPPGPLYDWTPQPDITAYELALLMPALLVRDMKSIPESCMRHLTAREHKP